MICQTVYCLPELIHAYTMSAFTTRPIYCVYTVLQNPFDGLMVTVLTVSTLFYFYRPTTCYRQASC